WRGQPRAVRAVIGGWTLSGMLSLVSGPPLHIRSGVDNSLTGVGWDRPDLLGSPYRDHTSPDDFISTFFNIAAFTPNQAEPSCNFGRNVFSGPSSAGTNISLVKSFPISERLGKVQFRSEFFNLFNSVNFGQPVSLLNNRNFGKIQSAGDPRILQFAWRYAF